MSRDAAPELRPVLLVLGAMFAFSLMAVFTRGAQANILGVAAWRAVFVAVVFAVSTVGLEGGVAALKPDRTTMRLGIWLGVALAIASSTFVGGYAFTTVANTIFLHNLAPAAVFPLAWWLYKERPTASAMAGAGIAVFGVALLSGVSLFQVSHFASARFLMGDLLAFISALGYAAVLVLTRLTRREQTPIMGTLFVAWSVAALILCVVAAIFGGLAIPGSAVLWILGLAVISTNVPFYLLNLGMRSVPAGMASVLSLSEVLFATVLGIVVYGEHMAPIGWIGAALAGLGVIYAVTQRDEVEVEPSQTLLPEALRSTRLARMGLALVLLNGGVISSVVGGLAAGSLMALVGLVLLARSGPALAHAMLDGRFSEGIRWVGIGLAAVAAFACFGRSGTFTGTASLALAALALAVFLMDRQLAQQESEESRDPGGLLCFALVLLTLGQVFGWMDHSAGPWLEEATNLMIALGALGVVVAGARGQILAVQPPETHLDALTHRWSKGRGLVWLVGVIWLTGAVHVVPTGHVGIVERFGAPISDTDGAGLNIRLPAPFERITLVDTGALRRISLTGPDATLLTGDASMVSVEAIAHYQVNDARAYAYASTDPEAILSSMGRAALLEVVARESQDAVLIVGREDIEGQVLEQTQTRIDAVGLGVELTRVHITRSAVPGPVQAAFLDVISADEERLTRMNQAEAFVADLLPRTRGDALAAITQAQGDAMAIDAKADGYATWFRSVSKGGSRAPELTRIRLGLEYTETQLAGARLILAPTGVRVWLGDESHLPSDVDPIKAPGDNE